MTQVEKPSISENSSEDKFGVIIKGVGGAYTIQTQSGQVLAKPRGIFRKNKQTPTVGDHVLLVASGDPDFPYVIDSIEPRRNLFIRPPVANLDIVILTLAVQKPAPDLKLLDKMLILCGVKDVTPVIWITKKDLDPEKAEEIRQIYQKTGFQIFISSQEDDFSAAAMEALFLGHTVGFAGQSGVGKSTLCNLLTGFSDMEIGQISLRLGRGKHTTRHVELFPAKGGFLIDTPGFSSLELEALQVSPEEVVLGYPELRILTNQCRFQDCKHMGELGCALKEDMIDPGRLERYREFVNELVKIKPYQRRQREK